VARPQATQKMHDSKKVGLHTKMNALSFWRWICVICFRYLQQMNALP
jgi:hypothetical protein